MKYTFFCLATTLALLLPSCKPNTKDLITKADTTATPEATVSSDTTNETTSGHKHNPVVEANKSMLSLLVTSQDYALLAPWQKNETSHDTGFAIYLGEGKFLGTASILSNATLVQFKTPNGEHSLSAKIDCIDYEADLALLSLQEGEPQEILKTLQPVQIGDAVSKGSKVTLISFNDQGSNMDSSGNVESANIGPDGFTYLDVKLDRGLTERELDLPVISDNKLISFTCYYDKNTQVARAINPEVLKTFVKRAGKDYQKFSMIGLEIAPTVDSVFRKYLKLPESVGGSYISKVKINSPSEKAGLKKGDVITSIDQQSIDSRGYIQDSKLGPVMWNYRLRNVLAQGDKSTIEFYRDGKLKTTTLILNRSGHDDNIIPPSSNDSPPLYIVHGGYTFQELTEDYMNEVNARNDNRTPYEFLSAMERKDKLAKQGYRRLIVISQIIPTPASLGYERSGFCLIETANGKPVTDLETLAAIIDTPSPDGILTLKTNKAPYSIYIDQEQAKKINAYIQQRAIPVLRKLK